MAKKANKKAASKKVTRAGKTGASGAGRKDWTAADMKALKTLIKQNTPTRLIALKLDRSVTSVYAKAQREGISLAPTNRSPRD